MPQGQAAGLFPATHTERALNGTSIDIWQEHHDSATIRTARARRPMRPQGVHDCHLSPSGSTLSMECTGGVGGGGGKESSNDKAVVVKFTGGLFCTNLKNKHMGKFANVPRSSVQDSGPCHPLPAPECTCLYAGPVDRNQSLSHQQPPKGTGRQDLVRPNLPKSAHTLSLVLSIATSPEATSNAGKV